MKTLREHFPMANKITYLDNAALVLKPDVAIKACDRFYKDFSVSVRTVNTPLGLKSYATIKNLRKKVGRLIDANEEEVLFSSGATGSLNTFALMAKQILKENDEILLSVYNHSSNFVPWIEVAKETKAKVVVSKNILKDINEKTKIVALSQVSNNLQAHEDMDSIYQKAHSFNAIVVNDAAQAIVYEKCSLKNSDVITLSANKFYGPTGFGILAIKKSLLKNLKPVAFGGGAVTSIDSPCEYSNTNSLNALYEPGTPNLAAIYMWSKSIDFFNKYIGYEYTQKVLKELSEYAYDQLKTVPNLTIYSERGHHLIMMNMNNADCQDVATYLGSKNIYVRSGIFCAHYLKNLMKEKSFLRVSLGIYNTKEDIDKLVKALKNGGDFLVL